LRRFARGEAGYTLFETLIVLAILLVVIGAIADGFVSASRAEVDQTARADDQQSARQALERMRRDIHCASAANVQTAADGTQVLLLTVNPGQCLGVTSSTDGVEWCTVSVGGSTTRYALYRTHNATCAALNSDFQVDYLTSPSIWTKACSVDSLAGVAVRMPVNRDPIKRPGRNYTLSDTISLRNATTASSVC
jgi:type II secretory pathway pseudopilin PulG